MKLAELASLRIVVLAGTLGQGGAERQLFYILKTLRAAGLSPHLLCLTAGEFWEAPIRALGVPITWVGQSSSRLKRAWEIAQYCRQARAQIIQSMHFYTNPYAAFAARLSGAREIGAVRSSGRHDVINTGRALGWLSLHSPRLIAANSRSAIQTLTEQGCPAKRFAYLPNVIEETQFAAPRKPATGRLRLLTVGRLVAPKRYDRLLNLMAQWQTQKPDTFHLTIVGDGPLRKPLAAQAQSLSLLPEVVEFRGALSDTAAQYQEADIFLLTSDYEGTPNVIMEAMAAGLPVISSRAGGVPDLIEHQQTGWLCEANDMSAWIDALNVLSESPLQRDALGQAARQFINSHHSLTRLPEFLAELYERALS